MTGPDKSASRKKKAHRAGAGALRSKKTAVAAPGQAEAPTGLSSEERWRMIAVGAYYKAKQRGFQPGRELDDWLAAEREVDALLGRR